VSLIITVSLYINQVQTRFFLSGLQLLVVPEGPGNLSGAAGVFPVSTSTGESAAAVRPPYDRPALVRQLCSLLHRSQLYHPGHGAARHPARQHGETPRVVWLCCDFALFLNSIQFNSTH